MSQDVDLACKCGEIRGVVRNVSPRAVNRVICYCDDCQAFLHHLGRADLLDRWGGTDIVQVAPSTMTFDKGTKSIAGVRLGPKGPFRMHAACCKTPLGNTVGLAIPFIGAATEIFAGAPDAEARDRIFGKPKGAIFAKYAIGGSAPGAAQKMTFGVVANAARLLLRWKLGGKGTPSPFFDDGAREPRYPITLLGRAERDALRAKCGPNPTSSA